MKTNRKGLTIHTIKVQIVGMKKALVILGSNENDRSAWSGTNYQILCSIREHFEAEYYQYVDSSRLGKGISFYYAMLRKLFGINREVKPLWYLRHVGKKVKNVVRRNNAEYVFTTNSHLIPFITCPEKKIIYISDATFSHALQKAHCDAAGEIYNIKGGL